MVWSAVSAIPRSGFLNGSRTRSTLMFQNFLIFPKRRNSRALAAKGNESGSFEQAQNSTTALVTCHCSLTRYGELMFGIVVSSSGSDLTQQLAKLGALVSLRIST